MVQTLARGKFFLGEPAPDVCIKQFLKFRHWFYVGLFPSHI